MSRNISNIRYINQILVAPREGCVSRNFPEQIFYFSLSVAPREGCVSRNDAPPIHLMKNRGCTP